MGAKKAKNISSLVARFKYSTVCVLAVCITLAIGNAEQYTHLEARASYGSTRLPQNRTTQRCDSASEESLSESQAGVLAID